MLTGTAATEGTHASVAAKSKQSTVLCWQGARVLIPRAIGTKRHRVQAGRKRTGAGSHAGEREPARGHLGQQGGARAMDSGRAEPQLRRQGAAGTSLLMCIRTCLRLLLAGGVLPGLVLNLLSFVGGSIRPAPCMVMMSRQVQFMLPMRQASPQRPSFLNSVRHAVCLHQIARRERQNAWRAQTFNMQVMNVSAGSAALSAVMYWQALAAGGSSASIALIMQAR